MSNIGYRIWGAVFFRDKLEPYYPSDIGKTQVVFVYSIIVEYGFLGNTKSQSLLYFANSPRVKNNALNSLETIDSKLFTMEYTEKLQGITFTAFKKKFVMYKEQKKNL